MKKIIPALMLIGMSLLAPKQAEAQEQYVYVENAVTNKNMFLGMNFGNQPMMQPYVELGSDPLAIATWMNYDLKNKEVSEVDYYLTYKLPEIAENFSASATLANYVFPTFEYETDQEFKTKVTYSGLPVDVSLGGGKLLDEKGGHAEILVNKNFELTDKINASVGGELFFNDNYYSGDASGFTHTGVKTTLNYAISDDFGLLGTVAVQKKLSKNFEGLVFDEGYFNITAYKNF